MVFCTLTKVSAWLFAPSKYVLENQTFLNLSNMYLVAIYKSTFGEDNLRAVVSNPEN